MKVKPKRSKIIFQGRRSVQGRHTNGVSKTVEGNPSREMTPIDNMVPSDLEAQVELLPRDSLDQMTLHDRGVISSSVTDGSQVPQLFTSLPPIRDPLVTDTSLSQDETAEDCLPFHDGTDRSLFDLNSKGIPRLRRGHHVKFLTNAIQNAKYIAYDPQRPWLVYWCLTGLCVLGENLEEWRDRVLDTFSPLQNPSGGFGGGHGQISHAAPSYAVVLSLAMVGGDESLDMINRRTL